MARNASVENVFTEKDFDTVWNYLEKKFGYSKEWRVQCKKYVVDRSASSRYTADAVTHFLFFCQREINPLLNTALHRHEFHPTFMRMLYWMFNDRISERNKITNQFRNQSRKP